MSKRAKRTDEHPIKKLRKKHGVTQRALAERINCRYVSTISEIECGRWYLHPRSTLTHAVWCAFTEPDEYWNESESASRLRSDIQAWNLRRLTADEYLPGKERLSESEVMDVRTLFTASTRIGEVLNWR